ncbi:hypothetical protein BE08_20885 [Sorangium cellulosum]|uniref:Uncharacterized protein n=1 Tax=Sorangium cellulosum TaxID=56 RepID=A0A150PN33_SORCE|nr:hypothetical protein BE08_20885 [Sorangium cellulosum]
MGRAYITNVDISTDGRVVVEGNLSMTGLTASLEPRIYIQPPPDGVWEYDLVVTPTAEQGAMMLVPFSVHAPWAGNADANGVRIIQDGTPEPTATTLLKVRRVQKYTTEQKNMVILKGAGYNAATRRLVVDLTHGGGCFPHSFAVEWDGAALKSSPPQYLLNVVDLSEYDPCKALISEQLHIDLHTPDVSLRGPATLVIQSVWGRTLRVKLDGSRATASSS